MYNVIEESFSVFHTWLTPHAMVSEAVRKHRASIKVCLESSFGMTHFIRTGSTGNATGINKYSDTDYFAVIPFEKLKTNSLYSLAELRVELENHFPNTGIYVDPPAVVCPFGTIGAENTEIVLATYIDTTNGYEVYRIPDRYGSWINASPLAHNSYVNTVNDNLGKKVKPLIKFLKAWKYYNNVPISSFYLEIRATQYAENKASIIYPIDIKNILQYLYDNNLPATIDPTGISGYIYPCSTDAKKIDAFSKLTTALIRAEKACAAEKRGEIIDAIYWWNTLYNNIFPKYILSPYE